MDTALNSVAQSVRNFMKFPARFLNSVSGGRIKPNHVTLVSLLGHFSFVWALWHDRPVLAAVLLIFFGLMDTLDGTLARLQKSASLNGMLYDAVSDRIKEILVYVGLSLFIGVSTRYTSLTAIDGLSNWYNSNALPLSSVIIAVCGMSLVVSYVKAKGEMALSSTGKYDAQALNRIFSDGFARYEVRMTLVVLGLLTNTTFIVLHFLLVLLILTTLQRLGRVNKALRNV